MKKALETKFNLITSIHKKKGKEDTIYERIYINKNSLEEIKPSTPWGLKEHMHDSMLYKINEIPQEISTTNVDEISDIGSDIGEF